MLLSSRHSRVRGTFLSSLRHSGVRGTCYIVAFIDTSQMMKRQGRVAACTMCALHTRCWVLKVASRPRAQALGMSDEQGEQGEARGFCYLSSSLLLVSNSWNCSVKTSESHGMLCPLACACLSTSFCSTSRILSSSSLDAPLASSSCQEHAHTTNHASCQSCITAEGGRRHVERL